MHKKTNSLHILLIEDNEHDRAAFQRSMKTGSLDCNLKICERADEAEDLLNNSDHGFDLAVVDFDLPGMNGLDFFMKMQPKKNMPPFVMLTGAGSEKLAVKALRAGMYDYVVKDSQLGYLNLLPVILTNAVRRHADDIGRREAKAALKRAKDELEDKIRERTAELGLTIQALENEIEEHHRAEAELRQTQEQLRILSRKILDSQENERKLIAQEIHDGIGGSLAAIKFALEEKLDSMEKNPRPEVISLENIISQVGQCISESRRISARLRPSMLDDLGLLATISWSCREFGQVYPDIQIDQQLDVAEEDVPQMLKVVIYRVFQEAMSNLAKHSDADRVRLQLAKRDNQIEFSVTDNGCGFDPAEKFAEFRATSGYGLSGMRDRTMLCDGKFEIISAKGKGTTVRITLPCGDESIGGSA